MQPADRDEKLFTAWRTEDMRIMGIDIERGRPRAAFAAGKADAHRRRRIARQRDGRNLAIVVAGLKSRDQFVWRQHRRRAGFHMHDPGVQAGLDLILEDHRHAGQGDHGQQQRERKTNDGMDLQQGGPDLASRQPHGQNFTVADSDTRRASPIATFRMFTADG